MEGINVAAILLGYLGILVLGVTGLTALVLAITGKSRGALTTLSGGLLGVAVIAAWAVLSFLQRGMGFHQEGSDATIVLAALTLLLAGTGQFVAAIRRSGTFGPSLACAITSVVLLATAPMGSDALEATGTVNVLGAASKCVPRLTVGLALGVVLGLASLLIPIVPERRRKGLLAGMLLAALCGLGGLAAGDACVTTHTTLLQGFPGGYPSHVRVEIQVLGRKVSDETGFAQLPREGLDGVCIVSLKQAAWVFGLPLLGTGAGLAATWATARILARPNAPSMAKDVS